ncbi:MAG: hypothetical protein LQ347_001168 [Umbilicaria vellea]|nr:MAG: hypothetical protein LQ347_001168 [Umbilicaria vellea]
MEEENVSDKTQIGLEQAEPIPFSGDVNKGDEMRSCPGSTASQSQGSESEYDSPSPSPPPRPNKFHGPPSTWRTWTAAERELAFSLDQLRARDLAVHLYNAHALKKRARAIDRQQQTGHLEGEVNGKAWVPPKVWTAWPMDPDEIPREGEAKLWEDEADVGFRKRRSLTRPSEPLEDAVVGEFLRIATQRFRLRKWDGDDSAGLLNRSSKVKSRDEGEGEIEAKADVESDTESGSLNVENSQRGNDTEQKSEGEMGRRRRRVITLSQSRDTGRSTRSQVKSESMGEESLPTDGKTEPTNLTSDLEDSGLKPVLMADDERAREILQPTVHHILAKLDNLLMGLHQARQAYLPGAYDSASETQTDADELSGAECGKKRCRSGRSKSRSRGSKNKPSRDAAVRPTRRSGSRSISVASPNSESKEAQTLSSPPKPSSRKPRRRKSRSPESRAHLLRKSQARLGLRDWSDVLGIASMTGWDAAATSRAAERCAALFEDGITFRTLEEGMPGAKEVSFLPGGFLRTKDVGKGNALPGQAGSEDEMLGGVHVDGFLKPIQAKKSWKVRAT